MNFDITQPIDSIGLQATVIRANGDREDLGTIAYWNKNPLRRLWYRMTHRHPGTIGV